MTRRTTAGAFIALAAVVSATFWLFSERTKDRDPLELNPGSTSATAKGVAPESAETPRVGPTQSGQTTVVSTAGRRLVKPPDMPEELWTRALRFQDRASAANRPIHFFGAVLDQSGRGVPGVKVTVRIGGYADDYLLKISNPETRATADWRRSEKLEVLTDEHGRFSISGKTGDTLGVDGLSKEGYITMPWPAGSFDYGPGRDPRGKGNDHLNPIVFHLWRKGTTEPLIQHTSSFLLADRRQPYFLNLFTGVLHDDSNGPVDLTITFTRSTSQSARYDWGVSLRSDNGAVREVQEPFFFVAPEEGYMPTWEFSMRENRDPWRFGFTGKRFFVRSRSGQAFSRLEISCDTSPDGDARLRISSMTNPYGSRNLEPDPAKQITDPEEIRRLDEATARDLKH